MRTIIIWIVTVPPFLIFGGAGLAKVMGAEQMAQSIVQLADVVLTIAPKAMPARPSASRLDSRMHLSYPLSAVDDGGG